MANVMMVDAVGLSGFVMDHWPEYTRFMVTANIKSIDAVACVRKYLVDASMDRGLYFFIRTGITASMFISNPIHAMSQWELVATIAVPSITVDIIIVKTRGFISTGRM